MNHAALFSPRAQSDLILIWQYGAERWGSIQADNYILQMSDAATALTINPLMGGQCDEIRLGYRRYRSGSHVLFYRLVDEVVVIGRILHVRMDVGQHL